MFPDELFEDLFTDIGRRSVPPMIVAVVMVLQRVEGCSDREAVDRFCFDARWKYAAGGLDFDFPGFVHTVLVDMRARLAASDRPNRIFEVTVEAAKTAGLIGRRRVLDSTPLYDAVATMDTVTLIRSAIRGLLRVADIELAAELRAVLTRADDYTGAGKPVCDWEDAEARVALIDALAKDGHACLRLLDGRTLDGAQATIASSGAAGAGGAVPAEVAVPRADGPLAQAAALLAAVLGQDLDCGQDGVFRIARRVARDRVISTVDPQARHGHKTASRSFDGFKGHISADPDSEIITATTATPGNVGDASVAVALLADVLPADDTADDTAAGPADVADPAHVADDAASEEPVVSDEPVTVEQVAPVDEPVAAEVSVVDEPVAAEVCDAVTEPELVEDREPAVGEPVAAQRCGAEDRPVAFGDCAYGTGELHDRLARAGVESKCKTQKPHAAGGLFTKDAFSIDLDADTVSCPAGNTAPIRGIGDGARKAAFGAVCADCPLRAQCTTATAGRSIAIGQYEAQLAAARARQQDPAWISDYRATRPKVERKIGHLMRRRHGGRRARVRGTVKVAADFALLAAAINLARLGVLGH